MAVRISHVGLCVSDLEKSLRFYVDGLGFEVQENVPCGDEVGPLGEVKGSLTGDFLAGQGRHSGGTACLAEAGRGRRTVATA